MTPSTFCRGPSISRNARSLSRRSSFPRETALREPTMIIAVTLLSTAEKTTVMIP
jgi:hypothetical protein